MIRTRVLLLVISATTKIRYITHDTRKLNIPDTFCGVRWWGGEGRNFAPAAGTRERHRYVGTRRRMRGRDTSRSNVGGTYHVLNEITWYAKEVSRR